MTGHLAGDKLVEDLETPPKGPAPGIDADLATTDDRRDHMRGTLELIAGTVHQHNVTITINATNTGEDLARQIADAQVRLDALASTGYVDDCPACMATRCIEQIDEAEARELDGWDDADDPEDPGIEALRRDEALTAQDDANHQREEDRRAGLY